MHVLWVALLLLVNAVAWFLVVLGLPGNWLMVASASLLEWWTPGDMFSGWTLGAAAGLALLGELAELGGGVVGARGAGSSVSGAVGAIVGALVGGIAGTFLIAVPVLGSILGVCAGAFAGAASCEWMGGRSARDSLRSGRGAAVGRFLGTAAKLTLGVAIWLTLAVAAVV